MGTGMGTGTGTGTGTESAGGKWLMPLSPPRQVLI
jgi:hypothetical protein